jgi:hypothetical protein
VWFDGMDWSTKRLNARAEDEEREWEQEREREREREHRHRAEGGDDSSAGTPRTSDTSPVLSTSTLRTTPSSPPLGEHEHEEKQRREKRAAARVVEWEINPKSRPRLQMRGRTSSFHFYLQSFCSSSLLSLLCIPSPRMPACFPSPARNELRYMQCVV